MPDTSSDGWWALGTCPEWHTRPRDPSPGSVGSRSPATERKNVAQAGRQARQPHGPASPFAPPAPQ